MQIEKKQKKNKKKQWISVIYQGVSEGNNYKIIQIMYLSNSPAQNQPF